MGISDDVMISGDLVIHRQLQSSGGDNNLHCREGKVLEEHDRIAVGLNVIDENHRWDDSSTTDEFINSIGF